MLTHPARASRRKRQQFDLTRLDYIRQLEHHEAQKHSDLLEGVSQLFFAKKVRHFLCLAFPPPSWLRHCLCLVCSTAFVAKTPPLPCVFHNLRG